MLKVKPFLKTNKTLNNSFIKKTVKKKKKNNKIFLIVYI